MPTQAEAATYYVADPKGADGIAGTADDINSGDSYPGTLAQPFATFAKACSVVAPGDNVFIRGGTYHEILHPRISGTAGHPITFKGYPGETVTITEPTHGLTLAELTPDEENEYGSQYGFYLYGISYVTIKGLTIVNTYGSWAKIIHSDHIVIRDCNVSGRGPQGGGGLLFLFSSYNVIYNNTLYDGADQVRLIHADRNLVESNHMVKGHHTLLQIQDSSFNIIKDNYFYNEDQKICEIYDHDGLTPPLEPNNTKYNLFEANEFAYVPPHGQDTHYSGIQYSAQEGIIRFNRFYNTAGPGIYMTVEGGGQAEYNTHNRIYNNVFNHSDFAGIEITWIPYYHFEDNIIKNNSLANSVFVPYDTRFVWYTDVLDGQPVQFMAGQLAGFVFENNNLYGATGDPLWVIAYGRRDLTNPAPRSIATWQTDYPTIFKANIQTDPLYLDPATYDFHVNADSPMIDAGAFLTKTVEAGSGTVLPVADVRYFFDGFDMTDENDQPVLGDLIQLEGDTKTARVIDIDYVNNTLTLDQPLSWTAGQGVSLVYNGSAPDMGAYEYILYGDVNGVGGVDANDASLTAMVAVGLITLTDEQLKKADVNKNGQPDANDASLIAQYAVGLIDEF